MNPEKQNACSYLPDPMCLVPELLCRLVVGGGTFPFSTVYLDLSLSITVLWELSGECSYSISLKRARFALAKRLSSSFWPWDNEPSDVDVSDKDPRMADPHFSTADSHATDTGIFGPIKCCCLMIVNSL